MRDHTTTQTGWTSIRKLDQVGLKMTKTIVTQIDGCPYDINLEVSLNETELYDMGYAVMNMPEDKIAYGLEAHTCEKEMDVQAMMWLYITKVKMVLSDFRTDLWRLEEWDHHCPFLFECDPGVADADAEAMQIVRDSWV